MFNVAADLKRRFRDAEQAALMNWDIAAEVIDNEMSEPTEDDAQYINGFANLVATLPAVPAPILRTTADLRTAVGARRYNRMALAALLPIPPDATAFLTTLNATLRGATARASGPRDVVRAE